MTTVSLIICLGDGSCTPQANFEVVSRSNDQYWSLGLPLEGPFCSGEEVTICADFFYDSSAQGVDWLIGIIPFFGSGWDMDLIDLASQSVYGNGDLGQWVPDSIPIIQETVPSLCTYRDDSGRFQICNALCAPCPDCEAGLIEGDPMPGGWFWMTNSGCGNDGTPGEHWGIGSTTATVNFCIDLTVRTFDTEESLINNSDLTFGFQSFSDGVAGCWEDPIGECLKDEPQSVFLEVYSFNNLIDTLVCPLNPEQNFTNILEGKVIINDVNGCDVIGFDSDILNSIRLYFNQDGETQFVRSLVVIENTYSIEVPDGDFTIEIDINSQIFMGITPTEFVTSFGNENIVVLDLELGFTTELFEYYQDLDGDDFGNPDETIMACELIEGYVDDNTDCDDTNSEINPDAEEIPENMIDEDCDGVDAILIVDSDNDGFTNDIDCDDTNPEINPNAVEICDDIDNNCNSQVDEGLTFNYYYQDLDSDGYGGELLLFGCLQPDNTVFNNFDCDDTNPNIYPDAEDIPNNGIDEDCDGEDFISSTHELNGEQIEIYPNPVSDFINVTSSSKRQYTIRLYNTQGLLVTQLHGADVLDCSRLTDGIYILKVTDRVSSQSVIERIVVSH